MGQCWSCRNQTGDSTIPNTVVISGRSNAVPKELSKTNGQTTTKMPASPSNARSKPMLIGYHPKNQNTGVVIIPEVTDPLSDEEEDDDDVDLEEMMAAATAHHRLSKAEIERMIDEANGDNAAVLRKLMQKQPPINPSEPSRKTTTSPSEPQEANRQKPKQRRSKFKKESIPKDPLLMDFQVQETTIVEEVDPEAPSDEEDEHIFKATQPRPKKSKSVGRLDQVKAQSRMSSPSSPKSSRSIRGNPSFSLSEVISPDFATQSRDKRTKSSAAVPDTALSNFQKLKLQVAVQKRQQRKMNKAKKIQERRKDVEGYKDLWKEYEHIQAELSKNPNSPCRKSFPAKNGDKTKGDGYRSDASQSSRLSTRSFRNWRLSPRRKTKNSEETATDDAKKKIRRKTKKKVKETKGPQSDCDVSLDLKSSKTWYFDFEHCLEDNDGQEGATVGSHNSQASLSLLSETSMEAQRRLYAEKRRQRKLKQKQGGKKEATNNASSSVQSVDKSSAFSIQSEDESTDYGPPRRRPPSLRAELTQHQSRSARSLTDMEVTFSPEKNEQDDEAGSVSDIDDASSHGSLRDYGPIHRKRSSRLRSSKSNSSVNSDSVMSNSIDGSDDDSSSFRRHSSRRIAYDHDAIIQRRLDIEAKLKALLNNDEEDENLEALLSDAPDEDDRDSMNEDVEEESHSSKPADRMLQQTPRQENGTDANSLSAKCHTKSSTLLASLLGPSTSGKLSSATPTTFVDGSGDTFKDDGPPLRRNISYDEDRIVPEHQSSDCDDTLANRQKQSSADEMRMFSSLESRKRLFLNAAAGKKKGFNAAPLSIDPEPSRNRLKQPIKMLSPSIDVHTSAPHSNGNGVSDQKYSQNPTKAGVPLKANGMQQCNLNSSVPKQQTALLQSKASEHSMNSEMVFKMKAAIATVSPEPRDSKGENNLSEEAKRSLMLAEEVRASVNDVLHRFRYNNSPVSSEPMLSVISPD
jgi:hypothetical protein